MTKEEKREKNKARYCLLVGLGKCVRCAKHDAEPGYVFCADCREKKRKRDSNRYAERKANSLCVQCGKPAKDGAVKCEVCAEKAKMRKKEEHDFMRGNGICIYCGKEKAEQGSAYCLVCKFDKYDADRKYRAKKTKTDADKEKAHSDYLKRYERCKTEHLCFSCGKKIPAGWDKRLCPVCNDRQNRLARKRYQAKTGFNPILRGNGVYCAKCCKPVEHKGAKLCDKCYDKCMGALKIAWKNRPTDNEFARAIQAQWKESKANAKKREADKKP